MINMAQAQLITREEEGIDAITQQDNIVLQDFGQFLRERDTILNNIMGGNTSGSLSATWDLLEILRPILDPKRNIPQIALALRAIRARFYSKEEQYIKGSPILQRKFRKHLDELAGAFPRISPNTVLCRSVFRDVARIIIEAYEEFWCKRRQGKIKCVQTIDEELLNRDEKAGILQGYKDFKEMDHRSQFNSQVAALNALLSDWLRPLLSEGSNAKRAVEAVLRRSYHIQILFDLINPTEIEMAQFKAVQNLNTQVLKLREHSYIE